MNRNPLAWATFVAMLISIYLIFLVAIIARYLWILGGFMRGKEPAAEDPTKVSSGL